MRNAAILKEQQGLNSSQAAEMQYGNPNLVDFHELIQLAWTGETLS
jgi:hypothetical protein